MCEPVLLGVCVCVRVRNGSDTRCEREVGSELNSAACGSSAGTVHREGGLYIRGQWSFADRSVFCAVGVLGRIRRTVSCRLRLAVR